MEVSSGRMRRRKADRTLALLQQPGHWCETQRGPELVARSGLGGDGPLDQSNDGESANPRDTVNAVGQGRDSRQQIQRTPHKPECFDLRDPTV